MTERTHDATATRSGPVAGPEDQATVEWLEQEFPGWEIAVDATATWEGGLKPLWIARREGHHPQAEMTASKLHTRLTQYLEREERRQAFSN